MLKTSQPRCRVFKGGWKDSGTGKEVKRVLVDGAVFWSDPSSLKNLPAEMIDKVQVFDKASDQAQFTGISDGNEGKTINIVTAGLSSGPSSASVCGICSWWQIQRQVSIQIASTRHNVWPLSGKAIMWMVQNFAADDMAAMQTTSGRRDEDTEDRVALQGVVANSAVINPFMTNTSAESLPHTLGVNYTDKWDWTKSCFREVCLATFTNTNLIQSSFYGIFYGSELKRTNTVSDRDGKSFRFNARVEYTIDSFNLLSIHFV